MGFGNYVNNAINHTITDVVDIDGVVRKIDFNKVLEKVDINDVVRRIDWNDVLSTIDWDQQLERIDFNAVVKRVDTSSIIARSSSGIFSSFMDSVRTTVVLMDLYLWVVSRCNVWCYHQRQRCYLPPKPSHARGYRQRNDRHLYPKGRTNKAVAVQGRFCGFVSKAIAIGIDVFVITLLFGFMFQLVEWSMVLFLRQSQNEANEKTSSFRRDQTMWMLALYCVYWFAYFFLCTVLAGQTFGMVIIGVRVVSCDPTRRFAGVSTSQAFVRTCLLPLTLTLCWPLGVVGLYRRDGRMIHDLVAKSGMIYLWDAKMAKARRQAMREENDSSIISNDDDNDPLDDMLENEDDYIPGESGNVGHEVTVGPNREQISSLRGAYYYYQASDR
ncbi:RDD family protein [Nitzschia inconspicua]|uniref:RDD family protein n=1 Tax=Nitzschia inconspicua TaxID=303405 RepID=A0A9K3LUJ7_9STRA|nr:RDD family protein [Nitzschia inconspicua]